MILSPKKKKISATMYSEYTFTQQQILGYHKKLDIRVYICAKTDDRAHHWKGKICLLAGKKTLRLWV
jgi:hypothetical protein